MFLFKRREIFQRLECRVIFFVKFVLLTLFLPCFIYLKKELTMYIMKIFDYDIFKNITKKFQPFI